MQGITYVEKFISEPLSLFNFLKAKVVWDERMVSRKTASFGVAYNYSQISYPYKDFPIELSEVLHKVNAAIGFESNNCLINYYLDGRSKMGFHSDQIDILAESTGIAILSIGETRTLRYKNILNPEQIIDFPLPAGSLIYMTQEIQKEWLHSIPPSDTDNGRMSLTFRKMK